MIVFWKMVLTFNWAKIEKLREGWSRSSPRWQKTGEFTELLWVRKRKWRPHQDNQIGRPQATSALTHAAGSTSQRRLFCERAAPMTIPCQTAWAHPSVRTAIARTAKLDSTQCSSICWTSKRRHLEVELPGTTSSKQQHWTRTTTKKIPSMSFI